MTWDDDFSDEQDDEYTIPCPECKSQIYEDAEQCPVCGCYVPTGTHSFASKSIWVQRLYLLIILAVAFSLLLPFMSWLF